MRRLTVEALSKRYRIHDTPRARFAELLTGRAGHRDFTALHEIGFSLDAGESLGVIGNNGAGKSTLLKLVVGAITPTSGTVSRNGRLTAILELGAGFHGDFTGRDNVFFAGELMGLPRHEIERHYREIVEFSELQAAMEQPVKTYSTGMVMRLAFALVTAVEPEILVIDEALAVGDRSFQQKCLTRMKAIRDTGAAILFCSHSMHHITQFCDRAMWLEAGKVRACGVAQDVVEQYVSSSLGLSEPEESQRKGVSRPASGGAGPKRRCTVTSVALEAGEPLLTRGDPISLVIRFVITQADHYVFGVAIDKKDTKVRFVAETSLECGLPPVYIFPGEHAVCLSIDTEMFRAGTYEIKAGLLDRTLLQIEDYQIFEIEIVDRDNIQSPALVRVEITWDRDNRFGLAGPGDDSGLSAERE